MKNINHLYISIGLFLACAACSQKTYYDVYSKPNRSTTSQTTPNCKWIYDDTTFARCLTRAKSGESSAAYLVAKYFKSKTLKNRVSFHWYKVAAALGNKKALRKVFDG